MWCHDIGKKFPYSMTNLILGLLLFISLPISLLQTYTKYHRGSPSTMGPFTTPSKKIYLLLFWKTLSFYSRILNPMIIKTWRCQKPSKCIEASKWIKIDKAEAITSQNASKRLLNFIQSIFYLLRLLRIVKLCHVTHLVQRWPSLVDEVALPINMARFSNRQKRLH